MTKFFRSFKFENIPKKKQKVNAKLYFSWQFVDNQELFGSKQKGLNLIQLLTWFLCFVKTEWLWAIFSCNENQSKSCCFEMILLSTARENLEKKKQFFLDILLELRETFNETFYLNFKFHLIAGTRLFILIFLLPWECGWNNVD